jgi:hypothetical protein
LRGSDEAVTFLYNAACALPYNAACALRIAPQEANAPLANPQWSFAAKLYSIEN